MSDLDGIELRFSLAAQLNRMNYGNARAISADVARKAWPPTGDHDRTFEGAFRAMSLALGGNRPEASYTTKERIIRDLDESFAVEQNPFDGSWVIERLVRHCPHCWGTGLSQRRPERAMDFSPYDCAIDASEVIEFKIITKCDHRPLRDAPHKESTDE